MPTHSETRELPYQARQMFDLVGDVARYPEFLPWCSGARIRTRDKTGDVETITADLIISFKVFRERFGSRVDLNHADMVIDTEYLDGPFKFLKSTWRVEECENGCKVHFYVDFEMKNIILEKAVGVVFNEAMHRIVGAFEARAKKLYS